MVTVNANNSAICNTGKIQVIQEVCQTKKDGNSVLLSIFVVCIVDIILVPNPAVCGGFSGGALM